MTQQEIKALAAALAEDVKPLAAALAQELKRIGRNELPPPQMREYRRKKAVQMKSEGYSISYIAQQLNASFGTIVRDLEKSKTPIKSR